MINSINKVSEIGGNVNNSLSCSNFEAALFYTERGIPVLPLDGKKPLVKGGYKAATTSRELIISWFTKWPHANIGIATGTRSGLLVVDIDPRNGGNKSWERLAPVLEGDNGGIMTPTAITGGGGMHFFFACDVPVKSCQLADFPGIDILADNKFVVVDPSIHPETGEPYRWDSGKSPDQIPFAPAPDKLLTDINRARPLVEANELVIHDHKKDPLNGFSQGQRHDGLRDYAWFLCQNGRSQAEAFALVRSAASHCDPPYDQELAKAFVTSAFNKPKEDQREVEIITLPELMRKEIPPPRYTIPGLLPEGLVLLSALPKKGKSTAARNMALSVARGSLFADRFRSNQGHVLYLSLEEGERAARQCFEKMTRGNNLPSDLYLSFEWRQGEEAVEPIEAWIKSVEKPSLVVVDLLQRVRSPQKATEGIYAYESRIMAPYCDLAKRYPGLTILMVHHHNKRETGENQEKISGSTALTGGTDCNLTLERREGKNHCILRGSGRLIGEFEHVFVFDEETHSLSWRDPNFFVTSHRRNQVLDLLREVGEIMSVFDIQKELGENGIMVLLSRMCKDGLIQRAGRGRYQCVDCSPVAEAHDTETQTDPTPL